MTINFVITAPISPQFNCTHMPQGIAINHLNTPRSIPQASLQKWQLPGQIGQLQSVYSVGLIYF